MALPAPLDSTQTALLAPTAPHTDASDASAVEDSNTSDEWGVSSEDADTQGFPTTLEGGWTLAGVVLPGIVRWEVAFEDCHQGH